MTYREMIAPDINKVITDNPDATEKELRKLLRKPRAGMYAHHYKTWCNEVSRQLNKKFIKDKQIPAGGLFQ